ncbi:hypothetical protein SNE40_016967 [Patella caerulea]|uniref:Peptidase M3A/M3B catalytic domain-containing protein n=1 Tax=Patella caerulea TaxID=87958 RepID=A0AAN8J9I6_PATCE
MMFSRIKPSLLKRTHQLLLNCRSVSTLSNLAQAFNTRQSQKLNLSFTREDVGLFGIPELTDYGGFYILQEKVNREVDALLKEITSKDRKRKIVEIFDELSDCLCRVADMADFIRVAHPKAEYASTAEEACINLSGVVERLNTNIEIHKALKTVIDNGDVVATDSLDQRVAELFIFDFEQSGIHLPEDKREKFVKLNENILFLGSHFMQGIHKPGSIKKSKLPENLRNCFSYDGDNITVTGLYSDHYSDTVREAAYRIFLQGDEHQESLLDGLLSARNQLAKLVGFPTYAHRAIRGTMMETPENVMQFLSTLGSRLSSKVDSDYAQILKLKQRHGGQGKGIYAWDPPYYTALGRQEFLNLHSQDIAPYFSLGACMDGLNNLFQNLYGVSLQRVDMAPGEVWTSDVHKLAVIDEENNILGYIYCDFFERSNKPNQDCHYTIQGGRQKSDGSYQLPMVVLQLNLPLPQSRVPSLLTPGMLENLFHEFGHAMHSMLGRTKYQHVTGTRCSTDFAEVPSVLMEFFVSDPRVLSTFAKHYKTGESLPSGVAEKLCKSKSLFSASDMQLQVFYSMLDQTYHGEYPLGKTTSQVLGELQNTFYGAPYVEGTSWQHKFGHLVGYGAKYYSYLLSRAVASSIWYKCFHKDPFNRAMGDQYRYKMLAHGGGKHPRELVEDMLNEKPTVEKLVDSLIHDIEINQQ